MVLSALIDRRWAVAVRWKGNAAERTSGDDGSYGVQFHGVNLDLNGNGKLSTERSVPVEDIDECDDAGMSASTRGFINHSVCEVLPTGEWAAIGGSFVEEC